MRSKVQIITLGCSKNTVDTEHILAALPIERFEIVPEDYTGAVDYLLVNTCGFIGDAKQESIETILSCVEKKKAGLAAKLAVFGCLAQRYSEELPVEIPEVDAWFGAREFEPVAKYIWNEAELGTARYMPSVASYAYIKISEGCDRRCSYCAIPHIRGAHKSVPMELIVKEAEELAARGVKELIILAQDSTYYGLDLYKRRALAEVLQKLSEVDGIEWIRIHYSYPDDFPMDVLEQMASNPKICSYLDIPLQHISDKVLSNMHRHVTGAWTRELISRLRTKVPGVALRTTMIVGHPGEGEEEFRELLDFIREARFERLGAFMYSEEEGTWGALNLVDDVPEDVKRQRYEQLMEAQAEISLAYNESRIGQRLRVVVDSVSDTRLVCRSQYESPEVDGEIIVSPFEDTTEGSQCDFSGIRPGDFINVEITGADYYDLSAVII